MLQCQQHLFCVLCHHKFVKIRGNEYFLVQMTSCAMRYDVTYHPFPINSQYLKMWGVDSPEPNVYLN